MSEAILSRRATIILMVLGGVSLLSGFIGVIFWGHAPKVSSARADSYSVSALGHRALVELLESAGHHVLRSRSHTERKVGGGALLVLIEPRATASEIETMLAPADAALVVLPKWTGEKDQYHQGWIRDIRLVNESKVDDVLKGLGIDGRVERRKPSGWEHEGFSPPPVVVAPAQTMRTSGVDASIRADASGRAGEGVFFGSLRSAPAHWLLTDPDVLANHGVAQNAELVLEIFDRVLSDGQVIVIDETLHGHEVPINVWGELGRFPLVLVLASAVAMFGFWIWSGMRRFGSPLHREYQLADGTEVLIENTGQLLMFGGHSGSVVNRYFEHVVAGVANFYRLSPELTKDERLSRLRNLSSSRLDLEDLREEVAAVRRKTDQYEPRVLLAARRIRQWREETMHGTH